MWAYLREALEKILEAAAPMRPTVCMNDKIGIIEVFGEPYPQHVNSWTDFVDGQAGTLAQANSGRRRTPEDPAE